MVRDRHSRDGAGLETVLDALDDPAARTIIKSLSEPMTASELSERCDIPLSTTYRKLELLTDASLLAERTEIRSDGHHTTRYDVGFRSVVVTLTDDRDLTVAIEPRERGPDERLAALWAEVRRET
ncbi:winged helix-turn-helix domain-containing protein [Halegenticoccus tardaugens]|uniref:winged helix-turn-helix domain-containing protein n=1 Tax=Halegenticoccus tardaugens TaxID=2071624 RepID=UPI00100A8EFF|nr:helix-turn-helix domain-containing protein [Halegenticoccus tardaugens]